MEDNKKRELEESDNQEEKGKRIKLRCEYANVKVIVGGEKQEGTDDDEDKDEENKDDKSTNNNYNETITEKKVFWHYSQILASHSRYVDALLSAPLAAATSRNTENKNSGENEESSNNNDNDNNEKSISMTEISFPDISPSQWERMINFVTDPVAATDMTTEDAMELVILYDKYDFHTGLKLCDKILSSMFYKDRKEFKIHMHDLELLDRCVQVIVLSHEKNLKKTLEHGLKWLYNLFYIYIPECVILTVGHIRKLVPVIAYHKDDPDMRNVQRAIEGRLSKYDLDILSPMFPEFFVASIQLIVARNTTLKFVNRIVISNPVEVAGTYNADTDGYKNDMIGECPYCSDDGDYDLMKNEVGDWSIVKNYDDTVLFICNGSRCETVPPKTGWKKGNGDSSIHEQNLPVLSYYRRNDDMNGTEIDLDL